MQTFAPCFLPFPRNKQRGAGAEGGRGEGQPRGHWPKVRRANSGGAAWLVNKIREKFAEEEEQEVSMQANSVYGGWD